MDPGSKARFYAGTIRGYDLARGYSIGRQMLQLHANCSSQGYILLYSRKRILSLLALWVHHQF